MEKDKVKEISILLGAGFSKSLAGLPLASGLLSLSSYVLKAFKNDSRLKERFKNKVFLKDDDKYLFKFNRFIESKFSNKNAKFQIELFALYFRLFEGIIQFFWFFLCESKF